MKRNLTVALLAAYAAGSLLSSMPVRADEVHSAEDAAKANKHERRAAHEEHRAQRDAARGDVAGAEKNAEAAKEDEHRAHHEEHKAAKEAHH